MKIKLDPKDLIDINIDQHIAVTCINRQTGECEAEIAKDCHRDSWCKAVNEKLNDPR